MKGRIKIWLLILKNYRTVIRTRAYVPKLEALGYRNLLSDPSYSRSPVLAAVHFYRFGAIEFVRGGRKLQFTCRGVTTEFVEDVYLFLNPEVGLLIAEGRYPNALTHFVLEGFDEMQSGKQTAYLNEVVQPMMESGVQDAEKGLQRISLTVDGLEYDFVEDLYLNSHPRARQAVRAGRYASALQHFILVTLPLVQEGKERLYPESYFSKAVKCFEGNAKNGAHLCIYNHSDPDGLIDPFVVAALEGIRTMDCEVVFVTQSASEEECSKIAHLCSEFIIRNPFGRDLGSYYLAVKHCRARFHQYGHVIWANDSIYFPLVPVDGLIAEMDHMGFDVWGINETLNVMPYMKPGALAYHIQSFFVGFSAKAVAAGILDDFVQRFEMHPVLGKIGYIAVFELWTAKRAMDLNLRVGALCKIEDMCKAYLNPKGLSWNHLSATIDLWRQCVAWFQSPALKVILVRDDPHGSYNYDNLRGLIDPKHYDINLILNHVARAVTGPKPSVIREPTVRAVKRIERSPFTYNDALCVFAHYDSRGEIKPYVLRYLEALEEVGCEFIFVSEVSMQEELAKLPASVKRVVQKDPGSGIARDMGAYWLGMKEIDKEDLKFKRYLLVNDSVFFPVTDHKRMFAEMTAKDYDLWGVVENLQNHWHMMMYMWVFKAECFVKDFLPTYLADYRCEYAKYDQIRLNEMRFPTLLKNLGYKVGAYVTVEDVCQALIERHLQRAPNTPIPEYLENRSINMHHDAWDLLITKFNCPALKIEMLRDSALGARVLYELPDFLSQHTDYDYSMIEGAFADMHSIKT